MRSKLILRRGLVDAIAAATFLAFGFLLGHLIPHKTHGRRDARGLEDISGVP
jgi:hypothetical protein